MRRRALHRAPRGQSGRILSSLMSLVFLGSLCLVVYLARNPLLRFAGESWIVEDSLQPSDAIIVLSDDNFYADRATRAAQVFREGMAPLVVASGRRLRPRAGIAELMEHDLIERGVPKDRILRVAHDADNTREEAEALAPVAAQRKWKSVIVVTSNYHTRRARYIFEHVFPAGIVIRVTGARDGDFDPERWWEKRISIKKFAREMAGLLVAMWELRSDHPASPNQTDGSVIRFPESASATNMAQGAAVARTRRIDFQAAVSLAASSRTGIRFCLASLRPRHTPQSRHNSL